MNIFKEINEIIKKYPDAIFIGTYDREDMDADDIEALGAWIPRGEGEFEKDGHRIIIESKNTRDD